MPPPEFPGHLAHVPLAAYRHRLGPSGFPGEVLGLCPPLDQSAVGFPDLLDIPGPQLLHEALKLQNPVALTQAGHPAADQCIPSDL